MPAAEGRCSGSAGASPHGVRVTWPGPSAPQGFAPCLIGASLLLQPSESAVVSAPHLPGHPVKKGLERPGTDDLQQVPITIGSSNQPLESVPDTFLVVPPRSSQPERDGPPIWIVVAVILPPVVGDPRVCHISERDELQHLLGPIFVSKLTELFPVLPHLRMMPRKASWLDPAAQERAGSARTARAIRDLLRAGLAHRSSVSWWLAATATAATRAPSSAAPASKTAEGSRTTVVPWVVNEAQISHHLSEGPIPNPRRALGRLGQLVPEVAFPSSRCPKVEFHSSCRRVDPFSPCLPDRGWNQDPCPNDCQDDQNVPHRHSGIVGWLWHPTLERSKILDVVELFLSRPRQNIRTA